MNINMDNERTKRKYVYWLETAKRRHEDTVQAYLRAIGVWEKYTSNRDFRRMTDKVAGGFNDWLRERSFKGKPLAAATRYQTVRFVRSFFEWLATQPGRNAKALLVALTYLTVDRETVIEATSPGRRRAPGLEWVRRLVDSITVTSDVDRRDRALIAFLLLSGARTSAIATLRLGCFDCDRRIVYQDPKLGVKTKNRKLIITRLIEPDKVLLECVLNWVEYLRKTLLYGDDAPLFPRTRVRLGADGLSFDTTEVEPVYWSDGSRIDHIVKTRAEQAGLEPYDCHGFRHTHIQLALSKATSGEAQKAVSQNVGHSHFVTTASVYNHLDEDKVVDLVGALNFEADPLADLDINQLRTLAKTLKKMGLTDE